jgi:serine/threonine protein kinase
MEFVMPRLIDGFCPPGIKGYAPALDTIPEEPTREEFTLPCSKPSRDSFFRRERGIGSEGAEGVVSVVSLLDSPEHARIKDVFENYLGVTGSFVKKDLMEDSRYSVKKMIGAPLVFGKEVSHSSQVLALGVVNKTSRMFSLVFEPEDLLPDDDVFYELYRLEEQDLLDFIVEEKVTGEAVTQLARDIGSALVDLEDEGLLYRDMKLCNILRTFDGTFSLCDFGVVTRDDNAEALKKGCGTLGYLSPEEGEAVSMQFAEKDASSVYQKRSDWFPLGIIFYEMVTCSVFIGVEKYKGEAVKKRFSYWHSNMQAFVQRYPEMVAKRQVLVVDDEGNFSPCVFRMEASRLIELFPDVRERAAFIDFVLGLLNPDPYKRLHGRSALAHPFVTKCFDGQEGESPTAVGVV